VLPPRYESATVTTVATLSLDWPPPL
jgi:hypothetical protein